MTDARIASLKRSSLVLAALYAFASGANLVKEVVIAREFGATAAMDAFEIAFTLPNLLGNFLMGGLGGALIPHAVVWIGARQQAQRNLWIYVRAVSWRLLWILLPFLAFCAMAVGLLASRSRGGWLGMGLAGSWLWLRGRLRRAR
mgnify:CR=1 FL=1